MGQVSVVDTFDPQLAQVLMRHPDIYWDAHDAMSPAPETLDFVGYIEHPDVCVYLATYDDVPIGYVTLMRRTSIGAEIHVGFVPQARGLIAKRVVEYVIGQAFVVRGLLKLWAIIPTDNRRAILGARMIGFVPEGQLTRSIMRDTSHGPALRDLIILGLSK